MNKSFSVLLFQSLSFFFMGQAYSLDLVSNTSSSGNTQLNAAPELLNLPPVNQPMNWSLAELNHVAWQDSFSTQQNPFYAKLQVLLSNHNSSSGAIDGRMGLNTVKAISAFQIMQGLNGDGQLDQRTWELLTAKPNTALFIEYQITARDINQDYVNSIPVDYSEQAKMRHLGYARVTEMLAEKFHMDEIFLQQINPKANFKTIGEKIIVANVSNEIPKGLHSIIAHKGTKQLYLFNQQKKMIASFPATIGSDENPSPSGTHQIKNVSRNPQYSYSPSNFIQGNNLRALTLPAGPNNPVGNIWIGLSKPSFGIHGTPSPSLISKTASHGCIRLTNWDANNLGKHVKVGMNVTFLE